MMKLDKIPYGAAQYFKELFQYFEWYKISHADLFSLIGTSQLYCCKGEYLCKLSCGQGRWNQAIVQYKPDEN